jgi:hypothetical protein
MHEAHVESIQEGVDVEQKQRRKQVAAHLARDSRLGWSARHPGNIRTKPSLS